jgi:hypothetical protein
MTKAEPQAVASQEASLPRWSSGDHVVFRQVWPGGVWAAIPATVIEDSSEQISVYVAPDTKFAGLNCTRQEYLRVAASGAWECLFYEWTGQHHVWASAPGDACSIWTMWSATDWTHLGWKVNPETPLKRTAIGFDTTDHVLDASADLSSWQWKDEEEFATAIELGLFTAAEGERIRQETRRVVSQCVTSRRQQLQAWTVWRPPAGWTLPVLSNSWETA